MSKATKTSIELHHVHRGIRAIARVAIENEKYFCDLDGELGDADFGTSLATGFRAVLKAFPQLEQEDIANTFTKIGMIFSSTVGGTSGPIWGTAFIRAGLSAKGKTSLDLPDLVAIGKNAVQGIMARGGACQGDKTMLDALLPAVAKMEELARDNPGDVFGAIRIASDAATAAIEDTRSWAAKKGRQSYASERTIGTLDPGIVAVAKMLQAVSEELNRDNGL